MSKNYNINGLSPKWLELLFKFQWKLFVWWLYFMNLLTDLFGKFFFTNTSLRLLWGVISWFNQVCNTFQSLLKKLRYTLRFWLKKLSYVFFSTTSIHEKTPQSKASNFFRQNLSIENIRYVGSYLCRDCDIISSRKKEILFHKYQKTFPLSNWIQTDTGSYTFPINSIINRCLF